MYGRRKNIQMPLVFSPKTTNFTSLSEILLSYFQPNECNCESPDVPYCFVFSYLHELRFRAMEPIRAALEPWNYRRQDPRNV